MAKSLVDSVNQILTRVGAIDGQSAALTTLTDEPRQRAIDVAVQVINEGIDELYSQTATARPQEQAESTITLSDGTRGYSLASDLVQLRWPMIDKTNNQYLHRYSGGYNGLLLLDPEQDDTGLPHSAAINPTNGELHLDRAPTSVEDGRVYTYQYDKDLELTSASDTVPFSDAVFRAMVPSWVQLWKREMRDEFDSGLFRVNMGRAARFLSQNQPGDHYSPRG